MRGAGLIGTLTQGSLRQSSPGAKARYNILTVPDPSGAHEEVRMNKGNSPLRAKKMLAQTVDETK